MRTSRLTWTMLTLAAACGPAAAPTPETTHTPDMPHAVDVLDTAEAPDDAVDLIEPGDRARPYPRTPRTPGDGAGPVAPPRVDDNLTQVGAYAGPIHRVPVRTADGIREVDVIELGDNLVAEGDIIIGAKADLMPDLPDGAAAALVVPSLGDRWPDGIVPYAIAGNVTNASTINDAMDMIAERSPVRFVLRTSQSDYIRFIPSTDPNVSSSPVGRQGGRQDVRIWSSHSKSVIAHEILHSLGFWHEQSRTDRANYIDYHPECVSSGRSGNFNTHGGLRLGPFDFDSIMIYGSFNFSNGCATMTKKSDGSTWNQKSKLSKYDINALYLLYGQALGNIESQDKFGAALAVGDFDDDGFQDLAVSATGEAPGSDPAAGVVFLYKGTPLGLSPWTWISQETRLSATVGGLGLNEAGDQFGAALAVGDFNDDGVDDLAVGAPRESVGSAQDVGAVYVYAGYANVSNDARFGLKPMVVITQGSLGAGADEAGDRFGSSLAAGDYDHDGVDDLAVGAPYETVPNGPSQAGVVFAFKGSPSGFSFWKLVNQNGLGLASPQDHFGARLATGDLDGDGREDLVVGAPSDSNWGTNSGAVFLYRGGSSAAGQLSPWAYLTQSGLDANDANDAFGSSLATGDLNGDGKAELVVGASGDFGGRMFVFRGANPPTPWETFVQSPIGLDEAGDQLGAAAVIGTLQGSGKQLVVGAPREIVPGGQRSGALYLWKGTASGVSPWHNLTEEQLDANDIDDRLGSALAIGAFGGTSTRQLAAGAYTEKLTSTLTGQANRPEAGAVYLYVLDGANVVGHQMLTEETFAPYAE